MVDRATPLRPPPLQPSVIINVILLFIIFVIIILILIETLPRKRALLILKLSSPLTSCTETVNVMHIFQ